MYYIANNELMMQAKQLIEVKKMEDHIGVVIDLLKIDMEILNLKNSDTPSINKSQVLYEELCEKYSSIELLDEAIKTLKIIAKDLPTLNTKRQPQKTLKELAINNLDLARYGIYVEVLLKHKVISSVEEFIEEKE